MTLPIAPASPSPKFLLLFGGYACRLLRKRFANVRIELTSTDVLQQAQTHNGPLIIAMNHPSWWDPIVGVAIRHIYFPDRPALSPIEMPMYERFGFMRRLGMFGISPEHPDALKEMVCYVHQQCEHAPRSAIFITPQGIFTDVREPIAVRPGAGAMASGLDSVRVVTILTELAFWHDRRPELLLLARDCPTPVCPSTASWTRQIRMSMQSGADELAQLVIARNEEAFTSMLPRGGADVNPAFDLWQRLRGRGSRISPSRRGARA